MSPLSETVRAGFTIPILIQLVILICLRSRYYAGHYRTHSVSANLIALSRQCLDYGLAHGYVLFRTVKLFLISAYYIGRVDTPLFQPGIASYGHFGEENPHISFLRNIQCFNTAPPPPPLTHPSMPEFNVSVCCCCDS